MLFCYNIKQFKIALMPLIYRMEFIHHPYQPGETIAAIATPPGKGGVAIIRISGDCALDIAEKVFSGPCAPIAPIQPILGRCAIPEERISTMFCFCRC